MVPATDITSESSSQVHLSILNYMPYPYSIVEEYETIETIYDEILGTAKIFLVMKLSSGKVSSLSFFNKLGDNVWPFLNIFIIIAVCQESNLKE